MIVPLIATFLAGAGMYLLFGAATGAERSLPGKQDLICRVTPVAVKLMARAGLSGYPIRTVLAAMGAGAFIGAFGGWLFFGGLLPSLILGMFAASLPCTSLRVRRSTQKAEAAEAWPRMIDEIRLLCGSLGRPIPQALLEVGKQAPPTMRSAFQKAEREWLISTDFERTIAVLMSELADPTADTVCETLLIAHLVGGSDVQLRLSALAQNRHAELQARKDARAKQSGVRFARWFVLVVPLGMAMAGISIGDGRAAYQSADGQLLVAVGLLILVGCWFWSSRLIRLPETDRVFDA